MNQIQTSQYVFVAASIQTEGGVVSSLQAIKKRLNKGFWALRARTPHLRDFRPGDRVIFYAAGRGNQVFAATAELASTSISLPYREKAVLEPDFDYVLGASLGVKLTKPTFFSTPVPVRNLLHQLSFVGSSKKWGLYFRTPVIKITKEDLRLILLKSQPTEALAQ